MSSTTGDVQVVPAAQVPEWIQNNQSGIYLNAVLITMLVYDTRKSSSHTNHIPLAFTDFLFLFSSVLVRQGGTHIHRLLLSFLHM